MPHPSLDAEARDPRTTHDRLYELTQDHPELHAALVRNPSLPDVARAWILTTNAAVRREFEAESAAKGEEAPTGESSDEQASPAGTPDGTASQAGNPDGTAPQAGTPDGTASRREDPDEDSSDDDDDQPTAAYTPFPDGEEDVAGGDAEPATADEADLEQPTQPHSPVGPSGPAVTSAVDPRPAEPDRSTLADERSGGPIVVGGESGTGVHHHRSRSSRAGRHLPPEAIGAAVATEQSRRSGALLPALLGFLGCLLLLALVILLAFTVGRTWLSDDSDGAYTQSPRTSAEKTTTEKPSPSSSPTESASPTTSEKDKSPAPEDAQEMTDLVSPSGNITCTLSEDSVGCTLQDQSYGSDDGCEDGPFAIRVKDDEAEKECGTTYASSDSPVLAYGRSAKNGDMACESRATGMTCWNQHTGHGFSVNRASYDTF